jgi:hypothetical protein
VAAPSCAASAAIEWTASAWLADGFARKKACLQREQRTRAPVGGILDSSSWKLVEHDSQVTINSQLLDRPGRDAHPESLTGVASGSAKTL